jgi:carbon-monoxide dehydrogenase large subunit
MTDQGIGARLIRKEDDRYMRGRGQYVGDITLAGMQEVAFLRSPLAHARILQIRIPPALRERVFIAEDLEGVAAIRADTSLPGFQILRAAGPGHGQGALRRRAGGDVRGADPGRGEDMRSEIEVDFDPLPAVTDMLAGRRLVRRSVHEHWGDNLYLTSLDGGEFRGRARPRPPSLSRASCAPRGR